MVVLKRYSMSRSRGVSVSLAIKNLIRHSSSSQTEVALQSGGLGEDGNTAAFKYALLMAQTGSQLTTAISEAMPLRVARPPRKYGYSSRLLSWRNDIDRMAGVSEVSDRNLLTLSFLVSSIQSAALLHYLPADRTGIMHAHRVLLGSLLNRASNPGFAKAIRCQTFPALSPIFSSSSSNWAILRNVRATKQTLWPSALSKRSSQARFKSKRRQWAIRYFFYKPEGWKNSLPLMNTSSMVSELAPVVLYLRHVVQPGETLIIEEPESHLHPAMQVEFTRQIAALVNAGVRVIVTTHSEWVLEELANIVRRSELPKARRKEIPRGDFALPSDQVGAWLFKPKRRPKGSVVREIRLDDSGLYPSEFDEVARTLHNDWADISSWIGETE